MRSLNWQVWMVEIDRVRASFWHHLGIHPQVVPKSAEVDCQILQSTEVDFGY